MRSRESNHPIVMGIIVDASASMAENWQEPSGKKLPRIDAIREALNAEFKRISILYNTRPARDRKVDIFCLGLGFQIPQSQFNNDYAGNYVPDREFKHGRTVVLTEVVCDILALTELMPSPQELGFIEKALNERWNNYSRNILNQADIKEDIYNELRLAIQSSFYDTAYNRFRSSWTYKLYTRSLSQEVYRKGTFSRGWFRLLERYIRLWQHSLELKPQKAANSYFDAIIARSSSIFDRNAARYERLITEQLEAFVSKQARTILSALATGYSVDDVIELFEEKQAQELANSIYQALDKDIRAKISPYWMNRKASLWLQGIDLKARISLRTTDRLTESCVRKYTWQRLEPFARKIVQDLFARTFKQQSMTLIPYWLRLASGREVSKQISELDTLFPEVYEQSLYSSGYLFGNTPMQDAIDRAAIRLLDKKYRNWTKILVLVTDGEFPNSYPLVASERLKNKGVKIIGCCVSNENITGVLLRKPMDKWPEGSKALFSMATTIDLEDVFEQRLAKVFPDLPHGKRMFLQINRSEILTELINVILTDDKNSQEQIQTTRAT